MTNCNMDVSRVCELIDRTNDHLRETNSLLYGGVVRPDDGVGVDLRAMWMHQEVKRIREHTMYIRVQLGVLLFVVICFVAHRW